MATSVPLISELSTANSSCAISGEPSAKLSMVSGSCSSSSGEPPMYVSVLSLITIILTRFTVSSPAASHSGKVVALSGAA